MPSTLVNNFYINIHYADLNMNDH